MIFDGRNQKTKALVPLRAYLFCGSVVNATVATRYVRTWPRLFGDLDYMDCKPDLSDLAEKIAWVLDNRKDFDLFIEKNQTRMREAWQPEAIVQQMLPALRACEV